MTSTNQDQYLTCPRCGAGRVRVNNGYHYPFYRCDKCNLYGWSTSELGENAKGIRGMSARDVAGLPSTRS